MKTVESFIKSLVKIEFIEDSNCFGHYPFQMFVENKDSTYELHSLALGGNVDSCYKRFAAHKKQSSKRIYLSLDFPKGGDIENDFVTIFTFENNEIGLFAIPYSKNGETLDIIKNSTHLDLIKSEFLRKI